jgi:DNA repair protein RecO (recombination protein O)
VDERASGIILRTRLLTETSVIVQWLTPDLGRISTVAKGARRPKSPFRGKLDLFYEADFSFGRSRRSELHNLREVLVRDAHQTLRENLGWVQQASYCAALIEQTTETETPLPEVHQLMTSMLRHLTDRPPVPRTVFAFELKFLAQLGLQPDLAASSLLPGTKEIARALSRSGWDVIARLQLSDAQVDQLSRFLHGFLAYHLGKQLKGRPAALQIGN